MRYAGVKPSVGNRARMLKDARGWLMDRKDVRRSTLKGSASLRAITSWLGAEPLLSPPGVPEEHSENNTQSLPHTKIYHTQVIGVLQDCPRDDRAWFYMIISIH